MGILDANGPGVPPVDPSAIPMMTQNPDAPPAMPPTAYNKRPGLLARLAHSLSGSPMHLDPTVSAYLDPEQQGYLRSQGQARLASGLLQAGGPAPQGTQNFGSRMGAALSGVTADWPKMQSEMADRAFQLWQHQLYQSQYYRAQKVFNDIPLPPNATGMDAGGTMLRRYLALVGIGGAGLDMAKAMEPLVTSLTGMDPKMWDLKEVADPKSGQRHLEGVHKVTGQTWSAASGRFPATPTVPGDVPQQAFTNKRDVFDKYQTETADARDKLQQTHGALKLFSGMHDQLLHGDGPTQEAFMRQFVNGFRMKGARPGDADFNLMNEAQSTVSKWKNKLQGYQGQGKLLNAREIEEMKQVLEQLYSTNADPWRKASQRYKRLMMKAPDAEPSDMDLIDTPDEAFPHPAGATPRAPKQKYPGAP